MHASIHVLQLHVQAQLTLSDNLSEDGGFHLVPSFHKVFAEWTERSRHRLGKEYTNKMVSEYARRMYEWFYP